MTTTTTKGKITASVTFGSGPFTQGGEQMVLPARMTRGGQYFVKIPATMADYRRLWVAYGEDGELGRNPVEKIEFVTAVGS